MQTKADQFDAEMAKMAEQAKALSHPARLAILRVLAERSECICGEIVEDLPLAQSTVSRHLKVLKETGLIQGTVDGPSVCYCLAPEAIAALRDQFGAFFDGLSEAADSISC
ncbi:transcriptional regulator [Salinibacter sp. 10B]|uniref:ArsR/SmtB family transcription factor n=1 Tax=Salinibacter sp. 10B TaxID=1923971 RepID=UPI000CF3F328|nr:metalloregulator ArsR/SmtB family transcription factor [Salinibacter sp. 10B]PQJ35890.1 transcriptional regulator [Salinibacter sp. 10B]